jgi:hypothetical protein
VIYLDIAAFLNYFVQVNESEINANDVDHHETQKHQQEHQQLDEQLPTSPPGIPWQGPAFWWFVAARAKVLWFWRPDHILCGIRDAKAPHCHWTQ